ncbi:uncharacterized protein EURHEDRAFT_409892 [Aspergillus ruber CBS 135680]|uniref:Uncharacterized protein n=1 Tax=Aspergillus ruber (strain CBS 135680) TaxID=1388766 RepID=A0A017SLL7_ASPRC|nr:uncharacterized protein EURHEDRAFT_409892 [Aspergillus ruber CBS 135680]EYE97656.1 hypothetical protein EURHEDRAFT_409892 [Aspergillus ruber CBS 135680]
MGNRTIATVQPVAMIQLDPDEVAEMNKGFPVMVNLRTELFVFPPTPKSNVLKMARHGYGYEVEQSSSASSYSAPKLALKQQGQFLPAGAEKALRDGLALFLPRFKGRAFYPAEIVLVHRYSQGTFYRRSSSRVCKFVHCQRRKRTVCSSYSQVTDCY